MKTKSFDSRQRSSAGPSPRGTRHGERGLSLLECIASLAIAALVLSSTTRISEASATLVRKARVAADTVDVARNLLEHELGAPCGTPPVCPAGYRCEVTRSPVTALADRVRASAIREDGAASEELLTVAPAPACGS
jgi:prepilin-type N-terminal cleavage/methylation domain-containing protein